MKRHPLYSGSGWSRPSAGRAALYRKSAPPPPEPTPEPGWLRMSASRLHALYARHERPVLAVGAGLFALALFLGYEAARPKPKVYTQADIDAAVTYTLKHRPDPSHASVAAATVMPSVVRVTGYNIDETTGQARAVPLATGAPGQPQDRPASVGSGVVMDDKGAILTNFHVAAATSYLKVTFANGLVSDASMIASQPDEDLAVIKADRLPDDLKPATLVSTRNLRPGDEVVAVGFPFGIGPSVSSGVISGLKREWVFDKDRRARNLIQFDAAANPGNSGGPLVNKNGEVVGIVTGIINPTKDSFFVGIGFAVPIENAARAVGQSPF